MMYKNNVLSSSKHVWTFFNKAKNYYSFYVLTSGYAPRGLLGLFYWYFFPRVISLKRKVVTSPKIAINCPRIYEKLHCKGESYRFSGQQDPSVQTDILLLLYNNIIQSIYLGGFTSVCLCFIEILVVAIGLLVVDGVISVIIGFEVGWLSGAFVAAGLLFSLPILLKRSIN